ncbi:MAG: glycosyltransferase family 2 protein [Gemmataceae bacterium]|nr:glycosyltransferase family 2 protein [Gemmataceae bacterium]
MISIVIPVFNERESLAMLHGEILSVAAANGLDAEIVFVDDGSQDGSWDVIRQLSAERPGTRGIRFRRNFGKAAALQAGFKSVRGNVVFTMDADLQDDPTEIPNFLMQLDQGFDVVSGWKKIRHDPWHKTFPSRVFNGLVSRTTRVKLHDHNCGFKVYRAEVLREIRLYGELHRFVPVLADARGFKVGELAIHHRPRKFGSSKYGFRRFVKGFIDLMTVKFITQYGQRPQHLLGAMSLISMGIGFLGLLATVLLWFFPMGLSERNDRLLPYAIAALLIGVHLISIGFVAEMITAFCSREEDGYAVAERVGDEVARVETRIQTTASTENGTLGYPPHEQRLGDPK